MIDRVRIKNEILTQQKELNIVKEKNQQLQDEVNMSKTDDYMVKLARERLGLVKENETPVIHSTDTK
jgi:Septum formation initiator.